MPRDFTKGDIGVRVYDGYCFVIEKKSGVRGWQECGQRLELPLTEGFDSLTTIPASRLALAVRAYEMENPGVGLRELLTQKPTSRWEMMAKPFKQSLSGFTRKLEMLFFPSSPTSAPNK